MKPNAWVLVAGLAAVAGPAEAAGLIPKPIWGRSFTVTWSENRVQRVLPDGEFRERHIERQSDFYVSSAGRVFKRETAIDDISGRGTGRKGRGARSGTRENIVDENQNARPIDITFRGTAATITTSATRGARRITIDFDAGFQSCRAQVINGRETSASSYVVRSLTTQRDVEIQSVSTGDANCSVRDGNIFE